MTAIDMMKRLMRIELVSRTCLEETKTTAFRLKLVWQAMTATKTRSGEVEEKTAHGLSIGGAYVYQATPMLGLRAGVDMNIFDHNKTFVPYDTTVNFNLGAIISF